LRSQPTEARCHDRIEHRRPIGLMRGYQRLREGSWVDPLLTDLPAEDPMR
jgi:hypothetical protein